MVKNILILNMTRMGDLVQSTPAIAGLRKEYPNASITLVVSSLFDEFSKKIPFINKRVVFDIKQFENAEEKNKILWIDVYQYLEKFLSNLKYDNYDLLINLSHSKLSAFMISFLKIKNIRGFGCNENGDRIMINPWMQYFGIEPLNRQFNPFNLVEIFTRSAGIFPEDNPIQLLSNENKLTLKTFEKDINFDNDLLIGIQAGSSLEGRRWSPQNFAMLANELIEKLDAKIILLGVGSEKKLAEQIILFSKYKNKIIDLTGRTNIDQLTTLVSRCSYLITNDTGTMHIAAAVETTIVGLFFAHAHPFETAPFSKGHILFQARIPCAPCSYGVTCDNVICVDKVSPKHVMPMIQSHYKNGSWSAVPEILNLKEVNIYETCIGEGKRLRLRPLIKNSLTLNDIFREVYSNHWMVFLGTTKINNLSKSHIGSMLLREYDCSNINILCKQIDVKICALRDLDKLASRGINYVNELINMCSDKLSTHIIRIKSLSEGIEILDKKINQTGLIHPEIKPIIDIFTKRKENFQGVDLVKLSKESLKCYRQLKDEGNYLEGLLLSNIRELKIASADNFHAAVNSINVEVPGR
jgi:ADP-heptose:LPS heptosyltransferase